MALDTLAPITPDDLRSALTHDTLAALAGVSWVSQVMILTELLDRPDIEAVIDDDWTLFGEFGNRVHEAIKGCFGVSLAEISGLQELLAEYPEPIEYECIRLGLRLRDLGSERFTWRDLLVIVKHCPPGSPIAGALNPVSSWTTTDHMLAFVFDAVRALTWTTAANKDNPFPVPFPRPGDPPRVSPVDHHRERATRYAALRERQRAQKQLEA